MIRNIRHIQIKQISYHPKLFQAILTFEQPTNPLDESDDIESIKIIEQTDRSLKKNENKIKKNIN